MGKNPPPRKDRRSSGWRPLLPGMLALSFFCGCCSADISENSGGPGSGELLTASFCDNKSADFLALLTPETRKEFGEREFSESRKKICSQMGEPVRKTYSGKLRHPFLDIDLWKISFKRRGSDGKEIWQDALFQVVSANENGKEKIISFGFL